MSLLILPLSVLRFTVNVYTVVVPVYRLRGLLEQIKLKHIRRSPRVEKILNACISKCASCNL
jgi:hypothetical protein